MISEKENNTKLYLISILKASLIFVILSLILWSLTTQIFAYNLKYFDKDYFISEHFYAPYKFFLWYSKYYSYKDLFIKYFYFFIPLQFFIFFYSSYYLFIFIRKPKDVKGLHGTAEFATLKDVKETGLIKGDKSSGDGVIVGGFYDKKLDKVHYLKDNSAEHILLFAPTRTGKGVGLIIPTLLNWQGSCIVLDIKGENWALTSGWRKKYANNKILKFEPSADDGSSVRFNPLEEIRLGTNFDIADAQNIATILADPSGTAMDSDEGGHWVKLAYSLLTAVILHCCYIGKNTGKPANLSDVSRFLSGADNESYRQELIYKYGGQEDILNEIDATEDQNIPFYYMKATEHLGKGKGCHSLIDEEASAMIDKPDKEKGSVLSTALSGLSLYRDKIVSQNTSVSDFKIEDLMNYEQPVSLYFVITKDNEQRLKPLIRLTTSLIVSRLTSRMEFKEGKKIDGYKHRLLLLLDEFPALGKMSIIEESLSYIAGYGMKAFIIVQNLEQIDKIYTKNNSLMPNSNIRVSYTPNTLETAEYLSKMLGNKTVTVETLNISGKRNNLSLNQVSKSIQQVKRELMTPEEVMKIPKLTIDDDTKEIVNTGKMLIFIAGRNPIYGDQILFFKDQAFSKRAKLQAPTKSDVIRINKE